MAGPDQRGTSDCADEVTLARKEAKSRRRITGLRSKTTEARTHVDRLRAANAHLKKKLAEALEQEAATSEILRVISAALADIQSVLDVIVRNAARLCEAEYVDLLLRDGDASSSPRHMGHSRPQLRRGLSAARW